MGVSRDVITEESLPTPRSSGESVIPARIVIGVTGHRRLNPTPLLADQVRSAVERIAAMAAPLEGVLLISVLSPLAEGADRLVAREVLARPGSVLEVVLPLAKEDYMQDFESSESREEFEHLLSRASRVQVLPATATREEAYEQVGRYVVEHCDVLVALWDGKPSAGRGGTAEIVQYARETGCPLVWIHIDDPQQVSFELERFLIRDGSRCTKTKTES